MASTRRAVLGSLPAGLVGCLGSPRPVTRRPECPESAGEGDAVLGFAGDVMLGRGVNERWRDGPPAGIWDGLRERLASLDGFVVNLECCLSNRGLPRPGRTYHFRADPAWAVPALRAGGVTAASLANNHLLDYGPGALTDTVEHLSAAGIAHAGAGADLDAALRPAVVDAGELTIGLVALTDQSRSYGADPDSPGTAYARLDPRNRRTRRLLNDALGRLGAHPDLIVASLHWGPNWETHPDPRQRRFARWLIDRGIDVVHGHSAHVVQGIEQYRGRPIIYDAGDFVDDYAVKPGLHNDRSFLFELAMVNGRPESLRLRPVEIEAERVRPANEDAARWLRKEMRDRSGPFGTNFERNGDSLRVSLSC